MLFYKTAFVALIAAMLATTSAAAQFGKRNGLGQSLNAPHPGYTIEQARPDDFKPQVGAICFMPDGRLLVTSFKPFKDKSGSILETPNGMLYLIDNPTEKDPSKIKVSLITKDLFDPLGMNYVDGALYISDRNEVSKWTDSDNDGKPDKRETFASGWISDNYHHFTFGLPYDGKHFYITLSTNITFVNLIKTDKIKGKIESLNGPNPEFRGCLLKIDTETGDFEIVCGGLRTPNGVSLGPDGHIIMPDNQGAWKPTSGIYFDKQGAFFGHYNNTEATSDFYPDGGVPSAFSDQPITMPAVWVPQNECANSPGSMVQIPDGHPHAGQFLMAEITLGGIRRVQFEEVDGTWQGAIYRHSQGFEAGTNRLAWGPDGCLYVGGMGASGNWNWRNKMFGLQRLAPTGKTAFEFAAVNATKDGFRISFTKPVATAVLEDIKRWAVNAWTYEKTAKYGGPKIPEDAKEQMIEIAKLTASADGKSVELVLAGDRKPNHVYHIRSSATSIEGESLWSAEVWYTFHKAPSR